MRVLQESPLLSILLVYLLERYIERGGRKGARMYSYVIHGRLWVAGDSRLDSAAMREIENSWAKDSEVGKTELCGIQQRE